MFQQKGYLLESTKTVYWPEPMRYDYRYELEASREPKKLMLVGVGVNEGRAQGLGVNG